MDERVKLLNEVKKKKSYYKAADKIDTRNINETKLWKGVTLCVVSGILLVAANTCVKLASNLNARVSSWQMLFLRCTVKIFFLDFDI